MSPPAREIGGARGKILGISRSGGWARTASRVAGLPRVGKIHDWLWGLAGRRKFASGSLKAPRSAPPALIGTVAGFFIDFTVSNSLHRFSGCDNQQK